MAQFSQQLFDEICGKIADGKSLRDICDNNEDMPSQRAFFNWLNGSEELVQQYARARESQADSLFDECLSIADQYDPAAEKLDADHIQRARLRIDTRKWMAGKLRPKKYGEKVTLEGAGPDGAHVTEVRYSVVDAPKREE